MFNTLRKMVTSVCYIFLSLNCLHSMEADTLDVLKMNLYDHVTYLTSTERPRNYLNPDQLDIVAHYIDSVFSRYSERVVYQPFKVGNHEYKNVICSFGPVRRPDEPATKERIIIGAHYDVCGDQPGADDNASAVAGLLEIARLLHDQPPDLEYRIDLVAYTLEEPPFFGTQQMGSAVHANSLKESGIKVKVMICLEMIGYFSNQPDSQHFPLGLLSWFYPSTGNFIAIVSNFKSRGIAGDIKEFMQSNSSIPVHKLTSPSFLQGVDFSDHRNYWKNGYKAIMITDTAFFRNPNYHLQSDTIGTLNFEKMSEVVKGVYSVVVGLNEIQTKK